MAVIEKLDHSLHLELTVSLLYGQFDVLFIMLIYCQPFHLYDIDEIPKYLLKEGKEGVVRHDTKYPLRDAYIQVIDVVQSLIDRFERILVLHVQYLVSFALYDWFVNTRQRSKRSDPLDIPKRDIQLILPILHPGIVMNANAYTVEPMTGVDMIEQIIIMIILPKLLIWALEAEYEALQIGVAVGHQFYRFLLRLVVGVLLDRHARGEHELGCLELDILLLVSGVEDLPLELISHLAFHYEILYRRLPRPEYRKVLDHPHVLLHVLPRVGDFGHNAGLQVTLELG